jgi:hypothetical protein
MECRKGKGPGQPIFQLMAFRNSLSAIAMFFEYVFGFQKVLSAISQRRRSSKCSAAATSGPGFVEFVGKTLLNFVSQ